LTLNLTESVRDAFGPIGTMTAALAPASAEPAGGPGEAAALAESSLRDPPPGIGGSSQTGSLWGALVIALLLATALTALGREWRRSVY
jgi:hypothetical protein